MVKGVTPWAVARCNDVAPASVRSPAQSDSEREEYRIKDADTTRCHADKSAFMRLADIDRASCSQTIAQPPMKE